VIDGEEGKEGGRREGGRREGGRREGGRGGGKEEGRSEYRKEFDTSRKTQRCRRWTHELLSVLAFVKLKRREREGEGGRR
jgi:hypothetical protein